MNTSKIWFIGLVVAVSVPLWQGVAAQVPVTQTGSTPKTKAGWGFCGVPLPPPAARALQMAGSNPAALRCVVTQYKDTNAAAQAQSLLQAQAAAREAREGQAKAKQAKMATERAALEKSAAEARAIKEKKETHDRSAREEAKRVERLRTERAERSRIEAEARRPRTVTVNASGGGDYRDLKVAIEAVPRGSTIRLMPGTYVGAFVLNKNITLIGISGSEQVQGTSNSRTLDEIVANALVIKPILDNSSSAGETLLIGNQSSPTIQNVEIRNTGGGGGLKIWANSNPLIRNIRVFTKAVTPQEVSALPALASNAGRVGIQILGGNPTIEDSFIEAPSAAAVWFAYSSGGRLRGNKINNSGRGIVLSERANPTILNNEISGSKSSALTVVGTATGEFRANRLSGNSTIVEANGGRQASIALQGNSNPTFIDNTITQALGPGISLRENAKGAFTGTRMDSAGPFSAIYVLDDASTVIKSTTIVNWRVMPLVDRPTGNSKASIEAPNILQNWTPLAR